MDNMNTVGPDGPRVVENFSDTFLSHFKGKWISSKETFDFLDIKILRQQRGFAFSPAKAVTK